MDIDNLPVLGPTVDKSKVPPIHQKRILAFVNHFVTSTCAFLNDFILVCENKFIDLERKIQRTEAALVIIESKIASIPSLGQKEAQRKEEPVRDSAVSIEVSEESVNEQPALQNENSPSDGTSSSSNITLDHPDTTQGVPAAKDARYRKYFKMMQFGVPAGAVKIKMAAEGYDPEILDEPDRLLPDGIPHETLEE